jgi:hypothetical protein
MLIKACPTIEFPAHSNPCHHILKVFKAYTLGAPKYWAAYIVQSDLTFLQWQFHSHRTLSKIIFYNFHRAHARKASLLYTVYR